MKTPFLQLLDTEINVQHCIVNEVFSYSTSDNETPPISVVLIGQHLIFC